MKSTSIQSLIATSAILLSIAGYAAPTTSLPDFDSLGSVYAVAPLASSIIPDNPSIISWADTVTDTSFATDWMNHSNAHDPAVVGTLVQSGVDPSTGLSLVERAKVFLRHENLPVTDMQVTMVTDPEEDFHIAQVCFFVNATFDAALKADLKLTRTLVKETRIPLNMSLNVREAQPIAS
jgi:hypothetical protein